MRRYCSRWTAAEATLAIAWGGLAVGLMAYALARSSVGSGGLATFGVWQMSYVWNLVHARQPLAPHPRRAPDFSGDRG